MTKKINREIGVIDFETDPFVFNREPEPFAAGFYSKNHGYRQFWGENCIYELAEFLNSIPPMIIYAHNGGKFDFFFLLKFDMLSNPALIINGRIVKCGFMCLHELRDSYALLPLPLSKMGDKSKIEIDYTKMEKENRESHKIEIGQYLEYDCISLYRFVSAFIERFGLKLTVGATAISQLGKLHTVRRTNVNHDERFRQFYFGGRVECFESGKIEGNFVIYDVNSMYPNAMANFQHPDTYNYLNLDCDLILKKFNHKTGNIVGYGDLYFAKIIAHNEGCLPFRVADSPEKGRIDFNKKYGEFFACSHEIKAGCELGILKVEKFVEVYIPCTTGNFKTYVDLFIKEKIEGKNEGNEEKTTFAKLLLNSSYGKFATNPRKFKNWFILDKSKDDCFVDFQNWLAKYKTCECEKHEKGCYCDAIEHECNLYSEIGNSIEIWDCPAYNEKGFYDVAVAASITSASRATLLRAIKTAKRPLYCDTDSLICESMGIDIDLHPTKLGAWDFEGRTDCVYIAGKKIYACLLSDFDGRPIKNKKGEQKIKLASKGAKLTYQDVKALTEGKTITWKNDAPNFKLNGQTKFVERNIKKII